MFPSAGGLLSIKIHGMLNFSSCCANLLAIRQSKMAIVSGPGGFCFNQLLILRPTDRDLRPDGDFTGSP